MAAKPAVALPKIKMTLDGLYGINAEDDTKQYNPALELDQLKPYPNHQFKLYEGERLDDLVESIQQYGVMQPILVQPKGRFYEILSGHNRVNASRLADKTTIPAIILHDLTEDEAFAYVMITNLMQRGFSELSHSEKAAVLAMDYSKMFSQGKRNDILAEIKMLENPSNYGQKTTSPQVGAKLRTDEKIGFEYGLSKNTIARYLRINKLVRTFKEKLDDGVIAFVPAVTLSFLPEEQQEQVSRCMDLNKFKVDMKKASLLRVYAEQNKLDDAAIYLILSGEKKVTGKKTRPPTIGRSIMKKYFSDGQSQKAIQSTIDKALALYFSQGGQNKE